MIGSSMNGTKGRTTFATSLRAGTLFAALAVLTLAIPGCPPVDMMCTSDDDCAEGQVCNTTTMMCEDVVGCETDDDCMEDQVCTDGVCVDVTPPDCTTDDDCAEGEVCENGTCVMAEPMTDFQNANPEVDFDGFEEGTAVSLNAPDFDTLAQNEGCTCSWSADGAGTFDPNGTEESCTTMYSPATDDTSVTVDITCDGETRSSSQNVTVAMMEPPAGFSVSLDCPAMAAAGETFGVTITSSGESGTVTLDTTTSSGSIDDNTSATPQITLSDSALGSVTIMVTATDTVVDDNGTPDDDTDDMTTTEEATDSCTVTVDEDAFTINAGADRILFPNGGGTTMDFGTAAAFAAGGQLQSGRTGGNVPAIVGVVNRGNDSDVSVSWEVISVPTGANVADVQILNTSSLSMTYLIIPALSNSASTIINTGIAGANTNTVIPGTYSFRVTAVEVATGETASDEVAHTLIPAFTIPAAASPGSLQGIANAPQNLTNYTVAPSTTMNLPVKILSLVEGNIEASLRDAFDNTQGTAPLDFDQSGGITGTDTGFLYSDFTAVQTLNTIAVTETADGSLVDANLEVMSTTRGTYIAQTALSAGAASVAAAPAAGFSAFHVQTDLPTSLDSRANFASSTLNHFGLVNSTMSTSNAAVFSRATAIHGARGAQDAESWYAATAATCCDINGDGWEELILGINEDLDGSAGDLGVAIIRGVGANPATATNSPLDNSAHNFGTLTGTADTGDGDDLGDPNGTTLIDVFEVSDNVGANEFITDLECCDLDNDGNLDLVVGEPGFGTNAQVGRVHIYYGTSNNGFAQNPWTTTGATVAGGGGGTLVTPVVLTRSDAAATDYDLFGYRVECCDYNNDGVEDLVVSAPGGGGTTASTQVATNVAVAGAQAAVTTIAVDDSAAGNATLTSLAVGDLIEFGTENAFRRVVGTAGTGTGQIMIDRAVTVADNSVVNELTGATGAVYGFAGSIVRLSNTTVADNGSNAGFYLVPTSAQSGDWTGAALCCEDVSGDGVADIVYGAPGRKDSASTPNQQAGAVLVLNGGSLSGSISTVSRIFEGNAAQLGFGRDIQCTDYNGDSTRDFVVSALVGDATDGLDVVTKTGRVYFIPSTVSAIQSSQIGVSGQPQLSSQSALTGAQSDSNVGVRLCSYDFNSDGLQDVFTFGSSATAGNNVGLLINGSASFSTTVTASTTISDAANALFRTPALVALETGLDPDGVLYFTSDACVFCDVNGDQVKDLFFSGAANAPSDAYAIMGRASTAP